MRWYKKYYNRVKTYLLNTEFISFYGFRIRKIFMIIFKFYIPITSLFILLFSMIYYFTSGLRYINDQGTIVPFLDCYYFSTVTFFSVGYGDIFPYTNSAKVLSILQEYLSFIILTLYSGFIIPIFFVRRNDVSFHNQLYLCHNDDAYTLSFPIFNKGSMFYEMQGALSLTLSNQKNIITRYSMLTIFTTWFKELWYCDFEISKDNANSEDYMILYEILYLAISKQIYKVTQPKLKLCVHGIDSQTRGAGYFIKEYYLNGILISFSNKSFHPDSNETKNKYSFMEDQYFINFMNLLQEIVFPDNEQYKLSLTGLYEIENKHLHESCKRYKKEFIIL